MDPVYLQLPNSGILIQYTVPFGLNSDGSSNEEMGTTPDLVSRRRDRRSLPPSGPLGGIMAKERAAQFRAARAASRKVFSTGCRTFEPSKKFKKSFDPREKGTLTFPFHYPSSEASKQEELLTISVGGTICCPPFVY